MPRVPEDIKSNPALSSLWTELYYKDLDAIVAVVGRRGSCKSGSALSMGYAFDRTRLGKPRFGLDRVFFKATDYLHFIRSPLPTGSALIWDETGVEGDNREWYTLKNRLIKKSVQTSRYRNYLLFLTVPTLKDIDIGLQRLLTGIIRMQGKAGDDPHSAYAIYEEASVDPKTGDVYTKQIRSLNRQTREWEVGKKFKIPRPPSFLEVPYKLKKTRITEAWYDQFGKEMSLMQEQLGGAGEEDTEREDLLKLALANKHEIFDFDKKRFVTASIMFALKDIKVGINTASNLSIYLNQLYKRGKIDMEEEKNEQSASKIAQSPLVRHTLA